MIAAVRSWDLNFLFPSDLPISILNSRLLKTENWKLVFPQQGTQQRAGILQGCERSCRMSIDGRSENLPRPVTNNHISLQWRHSGRDGVSNHQPHDCLLNRLFRRRSKKTSKLRVTGLCSGNSPGTGEFPAEMASYAENVSIWWRHHVIASLLGTCYTSYSYQILLAPTGFRRNRQCATNIHGNLSVPLQST